MSASEIGLILIGLMFPLGAIGFFTWLSFVAWTDTKTFTYTKSYVELDYEEHARIAETVVNSTYLHRPIRSVQTDDGKFSKLPKGAYGRW
jgi:hypothetical protein